MDQDLSKIEILQYLFVKEENISMLADTKNYNLLSHKMR